MRSRSTKGPANACPCPHCAKPNDFCQGENPDLDLERGNQFICDYCGNKFEIVKIVEMVWLKKA